MDRGKEAVVVCFDKNNTILVEEDIGVECYKTIKLFLKGDHAIVSAMGELRENIFFRFASADKNNFKKELRQFINCAKKYITHDYSIVLLVKRYAPNPKEITLTLYSDRRILHKLHKV